MDSFRRLILPGFFRIGVNGRRHFGRRPVVTLRVSYRPFEALEGQAHHSEEDRGEDGRTETLCPEENRAHCIWHVSLEGFD